MNCNEELDALSRLAVDDSLPVFDAIIRCDCGDTATGMCGISLNSAKLRAASDALDFGWHFDKESGKSLCGKCWDARESKDGQKK